LGIPALNNTPYVNRLFRNSGLGRQTQSLMMMVNPRIIIQEEEEELYLGGRFTLDELWMLDNGRRSRETRFDVNGNGMVDFDSLISLITETVAPDTWNDVGGPGSIEGFPSNLSLVVSQNGLNFTDTPAFEPRLLTRVYPVGDLVLPISAVSFTADGRSLMGGMGDMTIRLWNGGQMWMPDSGLQRREWLDFDGDGRFWDVDGEFDGAPLANVWLDTEPDVWGWEHLTSSRKRYASIDLAHFDAADKGVYEALARSTSVDLKDVTLAEAIAYLEDLHNISIKFDKQALARANVGLDTPVTLCVKDVSLRSVLRLLLSPLQLEYVVKGGVILVVPRDQTHRLDHRIHDLLVFAPGMHTNRADIQAVLDAEAQIPDKASTGKIDKRAAALIDRARAIGWSRLSICDPTGAKTQFLFDGRGRCRIETQTPLGLKEQILCDGQWLWHQYPALGVGARRSNSRFHRAALTQLIPWLLSPIEDLARGADVRAIDDRTVAIVPHGSQDDPQDATADRQQTELRLRFAEDGRLAERQVVVMKTAEEYRQAVAGASSSSTAAGSHSHEKTPTAARSTSSDTTILRITYAADGTVQYLDKDDRVLSERKFSVEACDQPKLVPDESLVILPMPWRTREHVLAAAELKDDGVFDGWSDEDALAVLAAETAGGSPSMRSTVGWRFLNRGDRRIGLYTLLLAAGVDWAAADDEDLDPQLDVRQLFNPLREDPDNPLAQYVAAVQQIQSADELREIGILGGAKTGFLQQLAAMRDLSLAWQQAEPAEAGQKQREKLERQTARFLQRSRCMPLAVGMLSEVWCGGGNEAFVRVVDEAQDVFEKPMPSAFAVRFLHAEMVATGGDKDRALRLIESLLAAMLDAGFMPLVDDDTKTTFYSGDEGEKAWQDLVERITEHSLRHGATTSALVIARRLHELGEPEAAERIFASVTTSGATEGRVPRTLAAVGYLWSTDQQTRASAMLEPLLSDDGVDCPPALWKLAAAMAQKRGLPVRAAEYLDRALDLQYAQLPDDVDIKFFRREYRQMLDQYRDAAESLADAGLAERQRLVSRIVRVADRWRALDPDAGDACRLAADPLARLGAVDLAWDYITSPLAGAEQADIPWKERGREYHLQGRYDLAQRSYGQAVEADPTDAQILWQQAQALIESGNHDRAQPLFERLANGSWDPKYDEIRQQAQRALGRN
jgi:Tfp pilus assembly protein PilF